MNNPILYIVLNGELKMSPGKAAAQAVHSAMLLQNTARSVFTSSPRRTVIVLEAKNSQQIQSLYKYIHGYDIDADYYIDEGVNEVDAYSVTALAAFVGENEELRQVFEAFPLYNGHIEVKRVDDFGDVYDRVTVPGGTRIKGRFGFNSLKRSVNETR